MEPEIVFESDEMELVKVKENWNAEALLRQEYIFALHDVCRHLGIKTTAIHKKRKQLDQAGRSPWRTMGIRKVMGTWYVRMKVFAPFFRKQLADRTAKIPEDWDTNDLISQRKGVYYLADVCRLVPFSTHQLRYQAKKLANPRQSIGVWKDREEGVYLVDMSVFGPWLKRIWTHGFPHRSRVGRRSRAKN